MHEIAVDSSIISFRGRHDFTEGDIQQSKESDALLIKPTRRASVRPAVS
jgi:hypothetical protein